MRANRQGPHGVRSAIEVHSRAFGAETPKAE